MFWENIWKNFPGWNICGFGGQEFFGGGDFSRGKCSAGMSSDNCPEWASLSPLRIRSPYVSRLLFELLWLTHTHTERGERQLFDRLYYKLSQRSLENCCRPTLWDTRRNISQTFWHRLPIFQVDLHCVASWGNLVVPRTRRRIGDGGFSVAAPRAWNRLPTELKLLRSTDSFRRDLKTFLFHFVDEHQDTDWLCDVPSVF